MRYLVYVNKCYRYEQISWLPVLIAFLAVSVVSGNRLSNPAPAIPTTVSTVLSFASSLAGFSIGYSSLSCDFTSYYHPNVSRCGSLEKLFIQNLTSRIC